MGDGRAVDGRPRNRLGWRRTLAPTVHLAARRPVAGVLHRASTVRQQYADSNAAVLWPFCRGGRRAWTGARAGCHKPRDRRQQCQTASMGFSPRSLAGGGNTWSNRLYTAVRGNRSARMQPATATTTRTKASARWLCPGAGSSTSTGRAVQDPAGMARLDALYGRHAADRGAVRAAAVGKAPSPEHDRHAGGLPAAPAASLAPASGRRRPATTSPGGRAERRASRLRHVRPAASRTRRLELGRRLRA